jgi:hypothetical protein
MSDQTPYVARPVEKQPNRKFYLYVKRICSQCGWIHLYRKVDEDKNLVRYGCVKYYQPWLLGEEETINRNTSNRGRKPRRQGCWKIQGSMTTGVFGGVRWSWYED